MIKRRLIQGEARLGNGLWTPNTAMDFSATILHRLLLGDPDGDSHLPNYMFIEFDNSGGEVDPLPEVDPAEGLEYYENLNDSDPNRDYLVVPVKYFASESTDDSQFPLGNRAVFTTVATTGMGQHGLEFSDVVGSRIYGGALVARPGGEEDPSRDLPGWRFYFQPASQLLKEAGTDLHVTWRVPFGT